MGGLRFEPTVDECVSIYLKNKILGIPCECDYIIDADIYGDYGTPWEIFGDQLPWQIFVDKYGVRHDSCYFLYAFTCLRNVGKVGTKRKSRGAGIGRWSENSFTKLCNSQNQVIGYSKSFTYEIDPETQTLGQWTMMEYSINQDTYPELKGKNCDSLVICKIKREHTFSTVGEYQHLRKKPRRFNKKVDEAVDAGKVVDMPDYPRAAAAVNVPEPEIINIDDDLVDAPFGNEDCQHQDVVDDCDDGVDMPTSGVVTMSQNYVVDLPKVIDIEDELVDVADCQGEASNPFYFEGQDLADPNLIFDVPDSWFDDNADDFLVSMAGVG